VIFLTTGTQLPFDRLVRAVDDWIEVAAPPCEIVAQVLPPPENSYVPRHFKPVARLSPADYAEVFGKARLIISHAGMGTILTALTQGKRICIMPRQLKYDEHRNDHQLATVERLRDHPSLFLAHDEEELPGCLDAAMKDLATSSGSCIDPFAASEFTNRIRDFILTGKA